MSSRKDVCVESIADLAAIYGLSPDTVRKQIQLGAPKPDKRGGGYSLLQWGLWWRERGRYDRLTGFRGTTTEESMNWAQRKVKADALLAEAKLADLMAIFCRKDDVERLAAKTFTSIRITAETIPDRVSALVPRKVQGEVLRATQETISAVLSSARESLGRWAGDDKADPARDAMEVVHDALSDLPKLISKAAVGSAQKQRVRTAAEIWVKSLKLKMEQSLHDREPPNRHDGAAAPRRTPTIAPGRKRGPGRPPASEKK